MPIIITPIKKKKKKVPTPKPRPKNLKKKDPFRADKTKSLNREFSKRTAKTNEDAMKSIKKSGGGSMRKPRKGEKSMRKLTDESKAIRKFLTRIDMIPINIRKSLGVKGKAMGGLNSSLKDIPPENKGLPKLPKEVRNKMGFKKDGGTINKEFPEPEMRTGEFRIDMIPKEYRESFRKKFMSKRGPASRKTKEKKMMGGGAMNMMPRRMMMKKGGIARGGAAAISGTGFKGVY